MIRGAVARPDRLLAALLLLGLLAAAAPTRAAERVTVFAAASTATVLEDLSTAFFAGTGSRVIAVHASSSALAKQIANGAPADLFISANVAWMDYLAGLLPAVAATRRDLLANRLVLIAPSGEAGAGALKLDRGLAAAIGDRRLAMGDPDHVPAGIYGRQALGKLGLWPDLRRRVARMSDVRTALVLVERGEAAAGIVYASDALVTPRVAVVDQFPADSHPPILYPAAMVQPQPSAAARAFFAFLSSPAAAAVFARHGFLPPR